MLAHSDSDSRSLRCGQPTVGLGPDGAQTKPRLAQRHCRHVYPVPVAPPPPLLQLVLAAEGSESQSPNTAEPALVGPSYWHAHTGRTGNRRKHQQASALCGQRPSEQRATGTAAGPRVATATATRAPLLLLPQPLAPTLLLQPSPQHYRRGRPCCCCCGRSHGRPHHGAPCQHCGRRRAPLPTPVERRWKGLRGLLGSTRQVRTGVWPLGVEPHAVACGGQTRQVRKGDSLISCAWPGATAAAACQAAATAGRGWLWMHSHTLRGLCQTGPQPGLSPACPPACACGPGGGRAGTARAESAF
jgi:hypothetical protein